MTISRLVPDAVRRVLPLALAVTLLVGACGGKAAAKPTKVLKLQPKGLPSTMDGLAVASESSVDKTQGLKNPYIDALGLFSMRKDDLLQATLEVGRFIKSAKSNTASFQGSIVAQIGTTTPKAFKVGSHVVFLTTGENQSLAIWFKGRYFFVLATRGDFPTPRTLLRDALEIEP